jgi:hypothetical protein
MEEIFMSEIKNLVVKKSRFTANISDEILEELANLNGKLEKIKIPTGGGTSFEFPNFENADETIPVKEFSAVTLYHHPISIYYCQDYDGTVVSPDCISFDETIGFGNPGGACKNCDFNIFGSGKNGGKACKAKVQLYILCENTLFPMSILLPTSSIKSFQNYIRRLLYQGKKLSSLITKFSLKRVLNKKGTPYAQTCFSAVRELEPTEFGVIKNLIEKMKNFAEEAKKNGIQISNETGEN